MTVDYDYDYSFDGEPARGRWRWVVVGVLVLIGLAIAAATVVVVAQHWRDRDHYAVAHDDYLAGDCESAVPKLNALMGAARWIDTAGVTDDAAIQRDECEALLAAHALAETDPPAALIRYAAFVAAHPGSPLQPSATERATTLVDDGGPVALASIESCDGLDDIVASGVINEATGLAVRTACIQVYDDEGADAEALAAALTVLRASSDPVLTSQASVAALASPLVCGALDEIRSVTTIDTRPDELAPLLLDCISSAAGAADDAQVASLQIEFLSALPARPESPVIEAAVLQSAPACALADEVFADPALGARPGFIVNFTFWCAAVAEFSGDPATAADLYQRFLTAAPDDPRAAAAGDGLARALVSLAAGASG